MNVLTARKGDVCRGVETATFPSLRRFREPQSYNACYDQSDSYQPYRLGELLKEQYAQHDRADSGPPCVGCPRRDTPHSLGEKREAYDGGDDHALASTKKPRSATIERRPIRYSPSAGRSVVWSISQVALSKEGLTGKLLPWRATSATPSEILNKTIPSSS